MCVCVCFFAFVVFVCFCCFFFVVLSLFCFCWFIVLRCGGVGWSGSEQKDLPKESDERKAVIFAIVIPNFLYLCESKFRKVGKA